MSGENVGDPSIWAATVRAVLAVVVRGVPPEATPSNGTREDPSWESTRNTLHGEVPGGESLSCFRSGVHHGEPVSTASPEASMV